MVFSSNNQDKYLTKKSQEKIVQQENLIEIKILNLDNKRAIRINLISN